MCDERTIMRLKYIPGQYEYIKEHPRAIAEPEKLSIKLNHIFSDERPLYVELGCGKGQFIRKLAAANSEANLLGFEKSVKVAYRCVKAIDEDSPLNFYIVYAGGEALADLVDAHSVARIYLNFSDPWPKPRHYKRRMTHPDFLKKYERALTRGGELHMKTDNDDLFEYSVEQIEAANWRMLALTRDLHNSAYSQGNIMTEYEERFVSEGKTINKLIASPAHEEGRL